MLIWNANFQIPNSGVQAAWVHAIVDANTVKFYSDPELKWLMFEREYDIPASSDPYDYLLSLEEFSQYSRV